MHVQPIEPDKPARAFLPRLMWPLVALTCAVLVVAGGAIAMIGVRADRDAAEATRARADAVIRALLDTKAATLAASVTVATSDAPAFTLDPASIRRLTGLVRPYFETVGVLTVGPAGDLVDARLVPGRDRRSPIAIEPEVMELVLDATIRSSSRRAAASGVWMGDGGLVTVVAVTTPDAGAEGGGLVLGIDRVTPEALARLVGLEGASGYIAGTPSVATLTSYDGGAEVVLVARPEGLSESPLEAETPSGASRILAYALAPAGLALLFLVLAVAHARRVSAELALSQAQAQTLATCDPLSGLPNRLLFSQRLDQELAGLERGHRGVAVMFLDLDRFKEVNDTYGHQAGDALIKQVAERLHALLRGGDTLARFGGDEFAIIQTDVDGPDAAESLARRILDAIAEPFPIEGSLTTIGVSIGIALAPSDAADRETLMRLADTALYQAKNDGRNRYGFFERRMDEAIRMRKVVSDDLRRSISMDGLAVHYQPLVSVDGRNLVGVEALVRWPHPKEGMIGPDRFIALAEQSGLIVPLGEWVLRRACLDGLRWPGMRVAVNVSPIQFRQRDFVETLMAILEETGFDPTRLELELTEGVVVEDADAAEAAMMRLRDIGVNLVLDDFGTGYSSLIYLRRFAFDKIKIDRSFLESMEATGESAILVHSIVHLGRALGLTVTAEGVETKEQQRFLQALGCHQLQGFLFAKPMPAEDIDAILATGGALKGAA